MRFRLPVAGLVAGLMLAAPGQVFGQSAISIGALAGVSLANAHGGDKDAAFNNPSNRTGFLAGGMVNVPLGGILSLRPEVFYIQKGIKEEFGGTEATLKLDYIEIPVLLVVGVPTSGNLTPEFFAGPQFAFRVKCSVSSSGASADCNAGGSDPIKSTDYGLVFGAALRISQFLIMAQYDLGLNKIDNDPDPFDIKTTALMFKLGYFFN